MGKYEEITLEIKPTSHTGVLLSSSSRKGDYIALEMIRGNVSITSSVNTTQMVLTSVRSVLGIGRVLFFCKFMDRAKGEVHKLDQYSPIRTGKKASSI